MIRVGIKLMWRIQVRVATQPIVNLTAEQFINRFARIFAADIPHRHFETAHNTCGAEIGAMRKTRAICSSPHFLDMKRISTKNIASENIFGDFANDLWRICRRINFADTSHARISGQFYENEVATTRARWRVANHKCLKFFDLHHATYLFLNY